MPTLEEAVRLGHKVFNGKTCPHGHDGVRYVRVHSRSHQCVQCAIIRASTYQINNKAHRKEYLADYYITNKDVSQVRNQQYYSENAEVVKTRTQQWQKENPEAYQKNVRKAIKTRRERIRQAGGIYTSEDLCHIRIKQGHVCPYCNASINENSEIDHIMPLSLGGTNWPSNIQILCFPCSRRKAAKHPDVFAAIMLEEWLKQ